MGPLAKPLTVPEGGDRINHRKLVLPEYYISMTMGKVQLQCHGCDGGDGSNSGSGVSGNGSSSSIGDGGGSSSSSVVKTLLFKFKEKVLIWIVRQSVRHELNSTGSR